MLVFLSVELLDSFNRETGLLGLTASIGVYFLEIFGFGLERSHVDHPRKGNDRKTGETNQSHKPSLRKSNGKTTDKGPYTLEHNC